MVVLLMSCALRLGVVCSVTEEKSRIEDEDQEERGRIQQGEGPRVSRVHRCVGWVRRAVWGLGQENGIWNELWGAEQGEREPYWSEHVRRLTPIDGVMSRSQAVVLSGTSSPLDYDCTVGKKGGTKL